MGVNSLLTLLLPLFVLLILRFPFLTGSTSASLVGVNYGVVANNLPPPNKAVRLLSSIGVGRIKLYDADPTILRAFANTGVELIIGLPNRCVAKVRDPNEAAAWIRANVQAYLPGTKIAAITVGNEILTGNDTSLSQSLLPAMESLHSVLTSLGLDSQIAITTPHSLAFFASSYPPSTSTFRRDIIPFITPILNFLYRTNSPFLINAYPYFAYKDDPGNVSLDYVLFEPNSGFLDPNSKLNYENMLHAQVDAVYAAIEAAGGPKGVEVRISETGWPSNGDEDEAGATAENAAKYNGNLMKMVSEEKGTPMKPGTPLRVYVFALFNENMKPGPASERNYGLFKPDGSPAYHLGILMPQENSTAAPSSGGVLPSGGDGWGRGPNGNGGGNGDISSIYYSISGAAGCSTWLRVAALTAASMTGALLFLRS